MLPQSPLVSVDMLTQVCRASGGVLSLMLTLGFSSHACAKQSSAKATVGSELASVLPSLLRAPYLPPSLPSLNT